MVLDGRECKVCGEHKSRDDFYATPSGGIRRKCKLCFNAQAKGWAKDNSEKVREIWRVMQWRRQGISITYERYCEMVAEQGGRCAICDKTPNDTALCVDHCHTTGDVRGLLCTKCNIA